ncbi:MAG: ArsI/CadI family heavy metal resistance metalloenzyme [Sinimarinibacterium sp.]|jgi:catechol 2,3-dioxygenase-like lactoylglutathione lyase family enzyme
MKRFHVHLSVDNLAHNIRFYSAMFGVAPTVEKADYAKWMLDDPRINFAISARGGAPGLNHLGMQVDSEAELAELRSKADAADIAVVEQSGAACCYARSDKHWIQDPQGLAWETFHTLGGIPVFGADTDAAQPAEASGCCVPAAIAPAAEKRTKCCG